MRGQPPVVWDKAAGFQVYDAYGNCWIDWSSGVLITNAGHGRQPIVDAIISQASSGLLTSYGFASDIRSRLVERLAGLLPEPLKKIFLLTTGAETVECAIKLARSEGLRTGGSGKNIIILLQRRLSWPDSRSAASRRHSAVERMDRQPRSRLRASSRFPTAFGLQIPRSTTSSDPCVNK